MKNFQSKYKPSNERYKICTTRVANIHHMEANNTYTRHPSTLTTPTPAAYNHHIDRNPRIATSWNSETVTKAKL